MRFTKRELLLIYNTGRVQYHDRRPNWRIVLPFSIVCIIHDFQEIYPVWGDRFSLESLTRREWQIASRDCTTSNQDVTRWPVFSNLFHAFGALTQSKELHDAVCHSLSLIFIFFFVLFWDTNGLVYPDFIAIASFLSNTNKYVM